MFRIFLILTLFFLPICVFATTDADRWVAEAEYYQKKADGYRREALYHLKKAANYEREASYYSRKGKPDRAKSFQRRATKEMNEYKIQLKYAAKAEDRAADYLKRATNK